MKTKNLSDQDLKIIKIGLELFCEKLDNWSIIDLFEAKIGIKSTVKQINTNKYWYNKTKKLMNKLQ